MTGTRGISIKIDSNDPYLKGSKYIGPSTPPKQHPVSDSVSSKYFPLKTHRQTKAAGKQRKKRKSENYKMRGVLKRNGTVSQLLQSHGGVNNKKITDVFTNPVASINSNLLKNQTQSREYFKLADFLRKSTRAYNEVSPYSSLFSSAYAASSARTASFSEVGFVAWYLAMVKSRPVLTKSATCSLIYIAADLSSQTIASSESYDLVRTLRMGGYGMLILGPTLHFWFNFVSKLFPKQDLVATLKKMAMGQTIYGPIMTVVFLSLNASLQGESGEEIVARLKRDLLPTMFKGVMYWPVCDFITFRFIPVHLQPLVSNSFSYLWTVYLTYTASLEKAVTTAS